MTSKELVNKLIEIENSSIKHIVNATINKETYALNLLKVQEHFWTEIDGKDVFIAILADNWDEKND